MIDLGSDIFLFKNILSDDLVNKLLKLRKELNSTSRIDIHLEDMSLFYEFNDFWIKMIETPLLDEYFKVYNIEKNIGFNISEETINNLKKWISVRWRDVFLLHYSNEIPHKGKDDVHWDFSGITTIGCLSDNYLGGELCFPRQGVIIKLKRNDIVVFPGGITHPHYVENITKGHRDVIVGQSLTLEQNHKIDYI